MALSGAHHQGFFQGTQVSFPPSSLNSSAHVIKLKIDAILTLVQISNLAVLSNHVTHNTLLVISVRCVM